MNNYRYKIEHCVEDRIIYIPSKTKLATNRRTPNKLDHSLSIVLRQHPVPGNYVDRCFQKN